MTHSENATKCATVLHLHALLGCSFNVHAKENFLLSIRAPRVHVCSVFFFDQQRAEKRGAPRVLPLETCHTDHDIIDKD